MLRKGGRGVAQKHATLSEFFREYKLTRAQLERLHYFHPDNIKRIVIAFSPKKGKFLDAVAERAVDLVHQRWHNILFGYNSSKAAWETHFVNKVKYAAKTAVMELAREAAEMHESLSRDVGEGEKLGETLPAPSKTPLEEAIGREKLVRLFEALGKLSPEQRRMLELVHLKGLSQAKAAKKLKVSLSNATSKYYTALRALRKNLKP